MNQPKILINERVFFAAFIVVVALAKWFHPLDKKVFRKLHEKVFSTWLAGTLSLVHVKFLSQLPCPHVQLFWALGPRFLF